MPMAKRFRFFRPRPSTKSAKTINDGRCNIICSAHFYWDTGNALCHGWAQHWFTNRKSATSAISHQRRPRPREYGHHCAATGRGCRDVREQFPSGSRVGYGKQPSAGCRDRLAQQISVCFEPWSSPMSQNEALCRGLGLMETGRDEPFCKRARVNHGKPSLLTGQRKSPIVAPAGHGRKCANQAANGLVGDLGFNQSRQFDQ